MLDAWRKGASDGNEDSFIYRFDAIGTKWEIETAKPLEKQLRECILKRIEQFDMTYSRFRSDSLVSQIANAPNGGHFNFPNDSIVLFELYDRLYTLTKGAMDPLVGRDLELLGYDQMYSLVPSSGYAQAAASLKKKTAWSKNVKRDGTSLLTQRPLTIDVGAAGKGYLVDIVSKVLCQAGFTEFIVDGSGDLLHFGISGSRIGLEHPFDPELVIGVANIKNHALCASSVNRRAWGNGLHHVLDARTGVPVSDVVATWVIADNAITADGLATALFFIDAECLEDLFQFSWVRMFADGRAEISPNFDGELFS